MLQTCVWRLLLENLLTFSGGWGGGGDIVWLRFLLIDRGTFFRGWYIERSAADPKMGIQGGVVNDS